MNTRQLTVTDEEYAALEVLRSIKMNTLAAAYLVRELARISRHTERRARRCLELGEIALRENEQTVCFATAVEAALEARRDRRARTLSDFRYICKRLMARCPGLASRRIRSLRPADCAQYLLQAFDTPRQRLKAHAILSGVFRTAQQRGWCSTNPMYNVEKPRISEKPIRILSREEIEQLISAANDYRGGICLPAVGLMLYAGLRPHEVARLRWADINLIHKSICIQPQHSKTGGARRVSIHPPLLSILSRTAQSPQSSICPRNWLHHWRELHRTGGFSPWQPDVLRHTFATHHLATFRSYAELQLEMGHRSAELLRTRYVAMEGIYRRGESILVG